MGAYRSPRRPGDRKVAVSSTRGDVCYIRIRKAVITGHMGRRPQLSTRRYPEEDFQMQRKDGRAHDLRRRRTSRGPILERQPDPRLARLSPASPCLQVVIALVFFSLPRPYPSQGRSSNPARGKPK